MSSGNWGPPVCITREEHDAIVARRGRPLTADPMRAAEPSEEAPETKSIFDDYLNTKGNQ